MSRTAEKHLRLFLDRLTDRSDLSDEEQQAILALPSHEISYARRRDINQPGESTSSAFLVASGMVARVAQTSGGMRQFTALHLPGDVADLHSAVRNVGIGGLHALCDTTILRIPHAELRQVATRYPAIAEAFWRDCMFDAAVLMQWVVNIGRRDAQTRISHLLCEMAIRCGKDRGILTSYALPLTQEQLGDAAALTPVHVNRTLKALGDLVSFKGGNVHIRDWAALTQAGDFDAAYLLADTTPDLPKRLLAAA